MHRMSVIRWTDRDQGDFVTQVNKLRIQVYELNADPGEKDSKAGRLASECRLFLDSLSRFLQSDAVR